MQVTDSRWVETWDRHHLKPKTMLPVAAQKYLSFFIYKLQIYIKWNSINLRSQN